MKTTIIKVIHANEDGTTSVRELFATLTATTNNVIDTSHYFYFAFVWDEAGANSASGNAYTSLVVTYSNIVDMRFP